jgi:hypothetical protein
MCIYWVTIYVAALTAPCCDNCILKKSSDGLDLTPLEADLLRLITRINERDESLAMKLEVEEQTLVEGLDDIQVTNGLALQTGKRVRQLGCRRQERLEAARNVLSNWC